MYSSKIIKVLENLLDGHVETEYSYEDFPKNEFGKMEGEVYFGYIKKYIGLSFKKNDKIVYVGPWHFQNMWRAKYEDNLWNFVGANEER